MQRRNEEERGERKEEGGKSRVEGERGREMEAASLLLALTLLHSTSAQPNTTAR